MSYDELRHQYKPQPVKWLLVAESPPPESADTSSSRHFYRSDRIRKDDRLFTNTIKALYSEAADQTESAIQPDKEKCLRRLQSDGVYMIEALEQSQVHEVTKKERQDKIRAIGPRLVERVLELAPLKGVVLIKSNVYEAAAEELRQAGIHVLNTGLVDYPGQYNQAAYRQKLSELIDLGA
jgi:hypothetical protein